MRVYKCELCGKEFCQRGHMINHLNRKNKCVNPENDFFIVKNVIELNKTRKKRTKKINSTQSTEEQPPINILPSITQSPATEEQSPINTLSSITQSPNIESNDEIIRGAEEHKEQEPDNRTEDISSSVSLYRNEREQDQYINQDQDQQQDFINPDILQREPPEEKEEEEEEEDQEAKIKRVKFLDALTNQFKQSKNNDGIKLTSKTKICFDKTENFNKKEKKDDIARGAKSTIKDDDLIEVKEFIFDKNKKHKKLKTPRYWHRKFQTQKRSHKSKSYFKKPTKKNKKKQ